jgi:hypothetical protein
MNGWRTGLMCTQYSLDDLPPQGAETLRESLAHIVIRLGLPGTAQALRDP